MKKFIVTYHAPWEDLENKKDLSPEDMKKVMESWNTWAERCGDGLVEMGAPLGNSQGVSSGGSSKSKSEICGFSVLQAEDIDFAKKYLDGHPHLDWTENCRIEIHEQMPMPTS